MYGSLYSFPSLITVSKSKSNSVGCLILSNIDFFVFVSTGFTISIFDLISPNRCFHSAILAKFSSCKTMTFGSICCFSSFFSKIFGFWGFGVFSFENSSQTHSTKTLVSFLRYSVRSSTVCSKVKFWQQTI